MMIMDYNAFRLRALNKKDKHKNTIKQLKKLKDNRVDQLFHEAHDKAFQEIDCLECAFCCTYVGPRWTQQDIKRVARTLKMKEAEFESAYLKIDEDHDYVCKTMPCPFLQKDKKCMIYDDRPKACREYPHTDRKKMKTIFDLTLTNATCCPAVEKILDDIGS